MCKNENKYNINVWIPSQEEFKKYRKECKNLYESLQDKITDPNTFDFICKNTFFYLFETEGSLIGGLYYFVKDGGKLFVNAFAKRKMHEICLECFNRSLKWFKGNVYAEAQNRASALCLLKCGFRRVKDNLFVFETKS